MNQEETFMEAERIMKDPSHPKRAWWVYECLRNGRCPDCVKKIKPVKKKARKVYRCKKCGWEGEVEAGCSND